MPTIFYPSVFNAPGAFTTQAPAATPSGFDVEAPETTRRPPLSQSYGEFRTPGTFGTTNTTQGGACFFPLTTTHLNPQQPREETRVAGAFTTTNTTQGGAIAYAPDKVRGRIAYQPDGHLLPPGKFTTTNTTQGGDVFGQPSVRKVYPEQPDSVNWTPGAFTTTNTTRGGETFAPAATRKVYPVQPDGYAWTPGVFAGVTPFVIKGWEPYYPPTARGRVAYQPDSLTLPPGRFTTTNTTQGGSALFPDRTRKVCPVQPESHVAIFVRPPQPPLVDAMYPAGARRPVPTQPDSAVNILRPAPSVTHPNGWNPFVEYRRPASVAYQPDGYAWVPGVFVGVTPPPSDIDNRSGTGAANRDVSATVSPAIVAVSSSLMSGLVAAYAFDGSLVDAHAGLNWTGPAFGYAAGKIGQALATNGVAGTIPHRAALITSGSFSVEVWVYAEAGGNGAFWSQIGASGVYSFPGQQSIYSPSFGVGAIQFAVAGVHLGTYIAGSLVGRWTHLIATYDHPSTTAKLFVDGVLRQSVTATADYSQSDVAGVGGMYNGAGTDAPMSAGRVDLNRVWTAALTDGGVAVDAPAGGEVAQLWNDGAGLAYPFVTYMMNRTGTGRPSGAVAVSGRSPNV